MSLITRRRAARGAIALSVFGACLAFGAGSSLAHHPEITAGIDCDGAFPVISYYSEAWEGEGNDPSRTNPDIRIFFDTVEVDSGAYGAPDFAFSGSAPVPAGKVAGDVVMVTAYAAGVWGNGYGPGDYRSTYVTIPDQSCEIDIGLGRFTGGGSQVRVGQARVTRGLTIHCDLELSNNLEVNWGGNRFHMTEHLQTVACTDDPAIIQAPPPAPLDTLIGIGTGRYNNVDGYTIEFTMRDYGEPGRNDQMAILIYQTSNPTNVVLNVPLQVLSGGNLQAHYDQPHK